MAEDEAYAAIWNEAYNHPVDQAIRELRAGGLVVSV
jgi:hypothetical protein